MAPAREKTKTSLTDMPRQGFTLIELLVVIAIVFFLCGLMAPGMGAGLVTLGAGWFLHLRRLSAEQTFDAEATITAAATFVLLVGGVHAFARSWQAMRPSESTRRWRLRWSLGITAGVALFALAGIAGVGVAHQTFWLISGPPPFERGSLRVRAVQTQSANNLKQIALATHGYMDMDEKKTFPPGTLLGPHGQPLHGWGTLLLPYLEHNPLAKHIRLDLPWTHPHNQPYFAVRISVYAPMEAKPGDVAAASGYAANVHVFGAAPRRPSDVTDGLANTLFYGEAAGNYRPWGHPCNWRDPASGLNRSPEGFGYERKTGVLFVLGDGSVRTLSDRISPEVLKALATPAAGETLDKDVLE